MLLTNFIIAQAASKVREVAAESLPGLFVKNDIHSIGHEYLARYGQGTMADLNEELQPDLVYELIKETAVIMVLAAECGSIAIAAQTYAAINEVIICK